MPLKSRVDGSAISEGLFGSSHFLGKYAEKCFEKFCSSLKKVDKKGKKTLQKRTYWKCGKYHLTIKAMNSHKRTCDGCEDERDNEEPQKDKGEDEKNEEDSNEVEFIGEDESYEVIYL